MTRWRGNNESGIARPSGTVKVWRTSFAESWHEADEELAYLLQFLGEDKLIIGSDYGHNDPSKEPQFVAHMRAREDVPASVIEKILCKNPRALYGLP